METRIKERDWKITEEIKKRKGYVCVRLPIFTRVVCAVCGDAVKFERIWKVGMLKDCKHKFICQRCATTWEEAYDKGQDNGNAKRIYKSSNY